MRMLPVRLSLAVMVFSSILIAPLAVSGQRPQVWNKPTTIKRIQNKPNRQPVRRVPKTQRAPLLTLQWQVLRRGDGNVKFAADPKTVFQTDDQIKLAITANQDGYLYIINLPPEGDVGTVIFPDPNIDGGKNLVKMNKEYYVPGFCPGPGFPDPNDCWWTMKPPAGREVLLVIFSRDKITTLPNDSSQIAAAGGKVSAEAIENLRRTSGQKVESFTGSLSIPGRPEVQNATRVQNTNDKDNEELITVIELFHSE